MKISNNHLKATFNVRGAEITSLTHNATGREYIWQARTKYWGRHAPVLFPFVGKLKKDQYRHEGKTYEMGQHGFARDLDFEIVEHTSDQIIFQLDADSNTLKKYPFKFELRIIYQLEGHSLRTTYEVRNKGKQVMYFSIGGHPAFDCPLNPEEFRSDYWLEFDQQETLFTHRLDGGLFTGKKEAIELDGQRLHITDHLFDKDALVFKQLNSTRVSLSSLSQKWLTFHFEGFPYLGIWSKSQESPFVCIEPWYGLADYGDHSGELSAKEGIRKLDASAIFSCHYTMEIH